MKKVKQSPFFGVRIGKAQKWGGRVVWRQGASPLHRFCSNVIFSLFFIFMALFVLY